MMKNLIQWVMLVLVLFMMTYFYTGCAHKVIMKNCKPIPSKIQTFQCEQL